MTLNPWLHIIPNIWYRNFAKENAQHVSHAGVSSIMGKKLSEVKKW